LRKMNFALRYTRKAPRRFERGAGDSQRAGRVNFLPERYEPGWVGRY